MIKGIMFDMGGTLLENINLSFDNVYQCLLKCFGLENSELMKDIYHKKILDVLKTRTSETEFKLVDLIFSFSKEIQKDVNYEEIEKIEIECNRVLCELRLVNHVKEVLEQYHKRGLKMIVLSNSCFSKNAIKDSLDTFELSQYFDDFIVSSEYGVRKPSKKFYEAGLNAIGLKASEVIMIGDTYEPDIIGSSRLKIHSIFLSKYKDRTKLENNKYLIKVIDDYNELLNEDSFEEIIIKKQCSEGALKCLQLLQKNNFEAYIVGGAVRNALLDLDINDYDITTSALPNEICKIFENENYKTILTGIKHGTVTVIKNSIPYEITTFRSDGTYLDNRHPDNVKFNVCLKEDLLRRDFTINAFCFDGNNLIDEFNGLNDIDNKLIRAVGEAKKRFEEDSLRILRAIRFSAYLGFKVEEKTKQAIFDCIPLLNNIAYERINDEILKLLNYPCSNIFIEYSSLFENVYHYEIDKSLLKEKSYLLDNPVMTPAMKFALFGPQLEDNWRDFKFSFSFSMEVISYQKNNIDKEYDLYQFRLDMSQYKKKHILNIIQYLCCVFNWNSDKIHIVNSFYEQSKELPDSIDNMPIHGKKLMQYGIFDEDIKKCKEELLDLLYRDQLENSEESILNYLENKYNNKK